MIRAIMLFGGGLLLGTLFLIAAALGGRLDKPVLGFVLEALVIVGWTAASVALALSQTEMLVTLTVATVEMFAVTEVVKK